MKNFWICCRKAYIEHIYFKTLIMLRSPLSAQVELTDLCNNRCNYCYNFRAYSCGEKNSLSPEDVLHVGREIVAEDIFSVVLTGGEPFLNKSALFSLVSFLGQNNIDLGINSNLTLVTDEDLERLRGYGISFLTSLSSSDERAHETIANRRNSYREALQGMERVQRFGHPLAVNMVVTKENFGDVYETGAFLARNGIKVFNATPMNVCASAGQKHLDLALSEEEYIETLDSLIALEKDLGMKTDILEPVPHCLILHRYDFEKFLKRSCCAGVSTYVIGADLSVRPCTHSDQKYGNLNEDSLKEIWARMQDWRDGNYIPQECNSCSIDNICRGGCRTEALACSGSLKGINPLFKSPLSLVEEKRERKTLQDGEMLTFAPGIRFRRESDSVVLLYSPRDKFLEMSQEELDYLVYLMHSNPSFTFKQILDSNAETPKRRKRLEQFVKDLYHTGFICSLT